MIAESLEARDASALSSRKPFGPSRQRRVEPMAFMFKLENEDGAPADPPSFRTSVLAWLKGDTIPLGHRTLRVVDVKDDDADQAPILVVEEMHERARRIWTLVRASGTLAGSRLRGRGAAEVGGVCGQKGAPIDTDQTSGCDGFRRLLAVWLCQRQSPTRGGGPVMPICPGDQPPLTSTWRRRLPPPLSGISSTGSWRPRVSRSFPGSTPTHGR